MRNTFLTAVTKRAREPVGSQDCVAGNVIAFPTHEPKMAYNRVLGAIEDLPDQYREALILVFLMGESYRDVARICDCPIGTLKSRISRGRHLIMTALHVTSVNDMIAVNY